MAVLPFLEPEYIFHDKTSYDQLKLLTTIHYAALAV